MRAVDAIGSVAGAAIGAACSIAAVRRFLVAMCIASLVACVPPRIELADELCFGTGRMLCLASAPTMPRAISSPTVIDTDMHDMCANTTRGNFCVVAATTLSIDAKLRATGSRPLVLLASESITIGQNGFVDVGSGSRPNSAPELGAGHDPLLCEPPVSVPMTDYFMAGGGAGGSFATAGASGGNGADAGGHGGSGGVPAPGVPASGLRGGCAGQDGGGAAGGAAGHGGGAVFLIAGTQIEVAGGINAGGEGGKGATITTGAVTTLACGGGGGGSGGMIAFEAPMITVTGDPLIHADGGGGGAAAGTDLEGNPGSDSYLLVEAARGGSGKSALGGGGGAGSLGGLGLGSAKGGLTASGASLPGQGGGGGGGGGGAGVIMESGNFYLGTKVSPPQTLSTP
jgi:hypothetical protein